MSSIVLSGDTSGTVTVAAPAVAGTNTATLPAATGTVMVSGNMPAFSATGSTAAIASTTFTKLQNNTKQFDTASCYDATTNYRFTPNVAGYYQVSGLLSFNSASSGIALISIYKNGARTWDGNGISFSSITPKCVVSTLIYMNGTTDYIELYGYQSTGVAVSSDASYFQASMVRAA